ncbi:MAG: hypothetical protein ACREUY_07055 [Burkholderiales bacterium]
MSLLIWELDAEVDCLNPEGESRAGKINSKEHEDLFNGELELQARKMLFDAQKKSCVDRIARAAVIPA